MKKTIPSPTITDALSELLATLGFEAMSRDVKTETDPDRIARYARIIVKASKPQFKDILNDKFAALKINGFHAQYETKRIEL